MAADDILSTKKTDQNLDNNLATHEVHPQESNLNLIPPLSPNKHNLKNQSVKMIS